MTEIKTRVWIVIGLTLGTLGGLAGGNLLAGMLAGWCWELSSRMHTIIPKIMTEMPSPVRSGCRSGDQGLVVA